MKNQLITSQSTIKPYNKLLYKWTNFIKNVYLYQRMCVLEIG